MLGNAPQVKGTRVMWAGRAPSRQGEATVRNHHRETMNNWQELNVSFQRQCFFVENRYGDVKVAVGHLFTHLCLREKRAGGTCFSWQPVLLPQSLTARTRLLDCSLPSLGCPVLCGVGRGHMDHLNLSHQSLPFPTSVFEISWHDRLTTSPRVIQL